MEFRSAGGALGVPLVEYLWIMSPWQLSKPRRLTLRSTLIAWLLILSSAWMALAWLGHLRFRQQWSFLLALTASWLLVLPEYALNTLATRKGYRDLSAAQMGSIHLASGVVCIAVLSGWYLGESFSVRTVAGFALMLLAIGLVVGEPWSSKRTNEPPDD